MDCEPQSLSRMTHVSAALLSSQANVPDIDAESPTTEQQAGVWVAQTQLELSLIPFFSSYKASPTRR